MKVISIANKKGGIGKTASAATLSALLGIYDQKVLVVDLNPGQANISRYFNMQREVDTIADLFIEGNMDEKSVRKLIKHTEFTNVDILPANETLYTDESKIPINTSYNGDYILKNALKYLANSYDYAFIDCGPNMNDFVINGLCASDGILIPVQSDGQCFDGFMNIFYLIKDIKGKKNPNLKILGVFFTMANAATNTYKQYYTKYKGLLGDKLLDTYIRRENILNEAVSNGVPLPHLQTFSSALLDYERLLRDLNLLSGKSAARLKEKINRGEKKEQVRKEREDKYRKKHGLKNSAEDIE